VSWQDRQYSDDHGTGYEPAVGGLRSWFGGLPAPTRAVKWIVIANVAMFLICWLSGGIASPIYRLLAMQTDQVLHGQIWRLLTFTYLHDQSGLGHIFFNMLGLYFLGVPLEQQWGSKRFFVFYTVGGFVGVLLYLAMSTLGPLSPIASLVGASGGVLAVLGACAVLFPNMRIILVLFPVPIRAAALIFVVLYGFSLLNQEGNAGGDACHLAGLAFGIAYGYRGDFWAQRWSQRREAAQAGRWEAKLRQRAAETEEVDRILEKVHREGINSLSRREKNILAEATRKQQEEDRRNGL
jgi:membrane associated rhomboid family serine protease